MTALPHRFVATLLAALLIAAPLAAAEPSPVARGPLEVTFLTNEGFLLEAGGRKVLVDALVGQSVEYVALDGDLRRRMERASPPFDGVDLVLATHEHGDHFAAGAVGRYLLSNPAATFVSTPEAVSQLRRSFAIWERIASRVRAPVPPAGGQLDQADLDLVVLDLHHGHGRGVENRGFLITLGGWTVLHMGDTEVDREELAASLAGRTVDVAFVPSWYFARPPWQGAVEAAVHPQHLVVMHLAADWSAAGASLPEQLRSRQRVADLTTSHPRAVVFRRALETHTFH